MLGIYVKSAFAIKEAKNDLFCNFFLLFFGILGDLCMNMSFKVGLVNKKRNYM